MIYSLTGKILEKTLDHVVISCGGVGYEVHVSAALSGALAPVGSEGTLYTYMNVSDNAVALFGFASAESRKMFLMLTSVSGVGPKAGLA
ncbi:MAG: Holliday junction branch migration protein RuvA, partial [Pygmaiobacter sp.]